MNNYKDKVVSSREITKKEYNLIINLLDKYKMDKSNFIKNCKTLKINKVTENRLIVNGYDPIANIIYYTDKSNLICELLHVASSNNNVCQGIIVKPNKVYPKPFGIGLNEGITDLFLENALKEEGNFPFEKLCVKALKYVYGMNILNAYFKNDDSTFRHQFNDKDITKFMTSLDEYYSLILISKHQMLINNELPLGLANATKITMDIVLEELIKILKGSEKNYIRYIERALNSKSMKAIYDVIGEYKFNLN